MDVGLIRKISGGFNIYWIGVEFGRRLFSNSFRLL